MFIQRDMNQQLLKHSAFVQIVLGPRQTGKSTLLTSLQPQGQERRREQDNYWIFQVLPAIAASLP